MLLCLLLLAVFRPISALKASCTMKLDGDGTEIGKVVFMSDGKKQIIQANLKGDPQRIVEGSHGFHIHEFPVEGNSCGKESTGGHYNPNGITHGDLDASSDSRHVGDFGNVEAGERGEVNFYADITIDELGHEGFGMLGRPSINCGPWWEKVWSDGRVEKFYGYSLPIPVEIKAPSLSKRGKKGKKSKKCTEKKQRKGKCTIEPTFEIVQHDPDCYVPMSQSLSFILHNSRFELEGDQSVVGRAVVLHGGKDDLGRGEGEKRDGSLKTGNAGPRVACCTLKLEE